MASTTSNIPRQVKKLEEIGDKKWQERYGKKKNGEEPTPVKVKEPEPDPAPAPPADPQPPEPSPPEPPKVERKPPEPAPPSPKEPEPPNFQELYAKSQDENRKLKDTLDKESQRYRTLQGMYQAKIPTLEAKLADMEADLEKMRKNPPANPTEIPRRNTEAISKFKEDWPELFDSTMEVLREEVPKMIEESLRPLRDDMAKSKETAAKTVEQKYFADLNEKIPGWQELQNDPDFVTFMMHREPHGRTRQDLLLDAFNRLDVEGTAYYFKEFQNSKKPASPPSEPTPPAPTPRKVESSIPRPTPSSPPKPREEKVYTAQDLHKLTMDKVRGKYIGREEEFKAKEREISESLVRQRKSHSL